MEKKNIEWEKLGFGYTPTDYRWQSNWKDGSWDEGGLVTDPQLHLLESACVFHYSQSCFEGLKAYTTKDGHIVTFRPDMNAARMAGTARRLEMPAYPEDKFVQAVVETVRLGAAVRHGCFAIHPSVHDRLGPADRRCSCSGLRFPRLRDARRRLFQGCCQAAQDLRLGL